MHSTCSFKNCLNTFDYRSNKKYCSRGCKQKAKETRSERFILRAKKRFEILNGKSLEYTKHKKTFCENCGFIPIDKCQLDVDHIDGNHSNNNLENLQTLCANCHRLKTHNIDLFLSNNLFLI